MGRTPCCEKKGLRKGAWTREEDETLAAYIQNHGHGCWRALPKKAGLLRCGKSCRFRWMNYLKPDVKRGNYSREEEETIIRLHELYGNRWSRIAAALPGRTDNEIKNVWHTHLNKRPRQNPTTPKPSHSTAEVPEFNAETSWGFQSESLNPIFQISPGTDSSSCNQGCQQQSSCEYSETSSISSNSSMIIAENHIDFCDIEEEFFEYDWLDAFWSENSVVGNEFVPMMFVDPYPQESFSNFSHTSSTSLNVVGEYQTGLSKITEESFENFWSESF